MEEEKIEVISELLKCKSRQSCCVFGCKSIRKDNRNISFHKFPKPNQLIKTENNYGELYEQDRREFWEVLLKMEKRASKSMTVCSLHFKKEDFHSTGCFDRKLLLPDAVPSQNLPLANCNNKQKRKKTYRPRSQLKRRRNLALVPSSTFKEPPENILTLISTIHADEDNLENAESKVEEIISLRTTQPLDHKNDQQEELGYKFPTCKKASLEDVAMQEENILRAKIEQIDNFDDGIKKEIEEPEEEEKIPPFEACFIKEENISDGDVMQDQEEMQFESNENNETSSHQNQLEEQTDKKHLDHLLIKTLKYKLQNRLSTCSWSNKLEFRCKHCKKYFPSKLSLDNHSLIHKSEGKYQCEECIRKCPTSKNITRHKLKHNVEKEFICETCNKKFTIKIYLKHHLLTH